MTFKIPLTIAPIEKLKTHTHYFEKLIKYKKNSTLSEALKSIEANITREEYLAICMQGFVYRFVALFVIAGLAFYFLKIFDSISYVLLTSLGFAALFAGFALSLQLVYPRLVLSRKQKEIERNLIPALQDMLVQLNSGIPLFSILANISNSDYGSLSEEFRGAVKRINSGYPQLDVLEEMGDKNPSIYFRRALWQISNGMRAGSDISIIIKESIKSLSEEQILQIQNYGNKLNPLVMFFMLIAVIMPALAITFLTIITSLVNLPQSTSTLLFISMGVFVLILQITFLGTVKSLRPTLL